MRRSVPAQKETSLSCEDLRIADAADWQLRGVLEPEAVL